MANSAEREDAAGGGCFGGCFKCCRTKKKEGPPPENRAVDVDISNSNQSLPGAPSRGTREARKQLSGSSVNVSPRLSAQKLVSPSQVPATSSCRSVSPLPAQSVMSKMLRSTEVRHTDPYDSDLSEPLPTNSFAFSNGNGELSNASIATADCPFPPKSAVRLATTASLPFLTIGEVGTVQSCSPGSVIVRGPRGTSGEVRVSDLTNNASDQALLDALDYQAVKFKILIRTSSGHVRFVGSNGPTRRPGDAHIAPLGANVEVSVDGLKTWQDSVVCGLEPNGTHKVSLPDGQSFVGKGLSGMTDWEVMSIRRLALTNVVRNFEPLQGLRAVQGQWWDGRGNKWIVWGRAALMEEESTGRVLTAELEPLGVDGGQVQLRIHMVSAKPGLLSRLGVDHAVWAGGPHWSRGKPVTVQLMPKETVDLLQWSGEVCRTSRNVSSADVRTGDLVISVDGFSAVSSAAVEQRLKWAQGSGRSVSMVVARPQGDGSVVAPVSLPHGTTQAEAPW
eukprot:Hpha_TRINITY_DN15008_c2_g12::TRINITY_DN15008_c2_g12_i1::g.123884::m.123884